MRRVGFILLFGFVASACGGNNLHYQVSSPTVVGRQVWYSVVRRRANADDEIWAVSCGIDERRGPLGPRFQVLGLAERDCWWQWMDGPGVVPRRVSEAREARLERAAQRAEDAARRAEAAELAANFEPIDRRERGELTDDDVRLPENDSPYDDYTIFAPENWVIEVDMTSSEFDTYLRLHGVDGRSQWQDDDGGDGSNSRLRYTASESGEYVVRANSYSRAGRGAYELHIRVRPR